MPHAKTDSKDADRPSQPALPPFAGAARPWHEAPLRRAPRRPAVRRTLPPFFMPLVAPGGPLPGSSSQPSAPSLEPAQPVEIAAAQDVSEDTNDLVGSGPRMSAPIPTEPGLIAVSEVQASDDAVEAARLDAAVTSELPDPWVTDFVGDAADAPEGLEMTMEAQGSTLADEEQAAGPELTVADAPDQEELFARSDRSEAEDAELFGQPFERSFASDAWQSAPPPPTYFEGQLPAASEVREDTSLEALRALFGDAYADESQVRGEVTDLPSQESQLPRSEQMTPVFGVPAVPPPRGARTSGTYRPRTSGGVSGRRTPVLGSRAVTPLSTPVIPLHPGIQRVAMGMSPTPASVPIMADFEGSRAVVHALESVASQIRLGHLVVVGTVPRGNDVTSLAAGLAAALAALLGVQQ